jgi:tetratricopeptide (TPR) repeat protein
MSPSSKNAEPVQESPGVLAGWKGIAAYFGCNVRTVRRYEEERGLPVHRAPGKKGSTIFARASELDAWLESREKEQRLAPAQLTSRTVRPSDDLPQNNSPSAEVTLPAAASSGEQLAKQASFLRWRPWVFAASAFLISTAVLFWRVGNHQTASATTFSQLDASNARPHVPAPGAEDLFLRGRYYWNLRTADGLAKAIDAYTQAIVADPSYAEAYAGLAESYDLLPQFGQADLGDSLRKAELAADRAIELNPNLAAAHEARAFALFYRDWDIAGSDAEFRKALALDPNSAQIHQWYASTLEDRLEGAECLKQIDAARRLSPASAAIAADAALFHANFGEFDAGMKALKEIEQTQPTLATPSDFLEALDFATGNYPAYVADARRYASITRAPNDVALADAVARGWAQGGRTGLLQARARALKAAFDRGAESGYELGQTLLLLGRPKDALPYFRDAANRRYILLITAPQCPWAKTLARDPGYAALFAQVQERLHGGYVAHPAVIPVKLRLPE